MTDIRKAVFGRVIGLSPSFYENIMTGEVLSRITTDTTLILSVIGSSVSVALRNVLILAGGLALMLFTSAKLTGLVLLIVPAVIVPIVVLGRRLRALSRENQDWIAASSGNASEALSQVQTVQAFTHEARAARAIRPGDRGKLCLGPQAHRHPGGDDDDRDRADLLRRRRRAVDRRARRARRRDEHRRAGAVRDLRDHGRRRGRRRCREIWGELQRAAGATERLVELLNATDSVTDPPRRPRWRCRARCGRDRVRGCQFPLPLAARASRRWTGFSFHVRPGETVALVGPSGAGKTTVIQLLLRFYDPQSGQITLDGIDLQRLARADFRHAIALVPQDPVIFAASARENIRFGRPDATDAEVIAAARAAAAHDFLAALPEGYDT